MKSTASKTHATASKFHLFKAIFQINLVQALCFSKSKEAEPPFFSPSFIQSKLTIGQPNDKYEQEADQMSEQVVQRLEQSKTEDSHQKSPDVLPKSSSINPIQRQCDACEQEEQLQNKEDELGGPEVMRKPIFESGDEGL